jgi:hypothetical protein
VVIVFAIGNKNRVFKSGQGRLILKGDKSPQHDLLRRGSNTVGAMSEDFTAC